MLGCVVRLNFGAAERGRCCVNACLVVVNPSAPPGRYCGRDFSTGWGGGGGGGGPPGARGPPPRGGGWGCGWGGGGGWWGWGWGLGLPPPGAPAGGGWGPFCAGGVGPPGPPPPNPWLHSGAPSGRFGVVLCGAVGFGCGGVREILCECVFGECVFGEFVFGEYVSMCLVIAYV